MGAPNVSTPDDRVSVMYKYINPIVGTINAQANQRLYGGRSRYARYTSKARIGIHPNKNNNRRLRIVSIHVSLHFLW